MKFRTGRKVGRTLYVQIGDQPDDMDLLIGIVDSADQADIIVNAVNAAATIRELHQPFLVPLPDSPMDLCRTCQQIHPCATLRALGGDDA